MNLTLISISSAIKTILLRGLVTWVVLSSLVGVAVGYQWPSNIKRCRSNETDFNMCLYDAAKRAIPLLRNGNRQFGFRPLDPLKFGNMTITSNRPAVNITFMIANGVIEGCSKMILTKISYDKKKQELIIEGLHKTLKMSGKYNAFGDILLLHINSNGNFEFENQDVLAHHVVQLSPKKNKGRVDVDLKLHIKNIGLVKSSFQDSSLNKTSLEALNRSVNENWKMITRATIPTMETALTKIFTNLLSPIFKRFPIKTIFPEMR